MNEKKKVGPQEFAEILGVNYTVVYKALQSGRLKKSKYPGKSAKNSLIEVATGVLEWYEQLDYSKSPKDLPGLASGMEDIPSFKASRDLKAHYAALNEQLTFEKEAKRLVSADNIEKEFFEAGRATRERMFSLIDEVASTCENRPQHEIRKLLKKRMTEEFEELSDAKRMVK